MEFFKRAVPLVLVLVTGLLTACAPQKSSVRPAPERPLWFGLHVLLDGKDSAGELLKEIPDLAPLRINVLILEINYSYEYASHPELQSENPISRETARKILDFCRKHSIRLIPEFQCLGHQSWEEKTFPFLVQYPEFDETPGLYPQNKGIYCRSWCPLHPEVNPIIFDLFDELIEWSRSKMKKHILEAWRLVQ